MKKLEAHLFGIILEIGGPYDDDDNNNYKENTFLKTIEYVNKKINLNFNATNENGDTFLIAASNRRSSVKIFKSLIGYGADVNAKNNDGRTALMLTSNLEIAKLLIDSGADVNARGSGMFGNPPLIIGVINYMGYSPLPYYEYSEILEKIKFLIDKGADVNVKDNGGRSVLEKTIDILNIQHWELVLEIVKLLVDNGANINAKDKNGNTALTYAKRKGNKGKEIVKFLMSRGAK